MGKMAIGNQLRRLSDTDRNNTQKQTHTENVIGRQGKKNIRIEGTD